MSKFNTTPPLVDLNANNSVQEVEIRLHEPLILKPGSRKKRIGLQILNALARLEVLLCKEEALASSEIGVQNMTQVGVVANRILYELDGWNCVSATKLHDNDNHREWLSAGRLPDQQHNKMEIDATVSVLEASLLQFDEDGIPKKDFQAYLTELGLTSLFPKSAKRLVVNKIPSRKIDVSAHFNEMNIQNQLVAISLRLQQDIKLVNHKYLAHQLVLLYQCLNQAGGRFLKYKLRVELHFDEVKVLTNHSEEPQLTTEQKRWLSQLTSDVVTEVLFSGQPVVAMSQPLASYLNLISEAHAKAN
ncbi:13539_t:CDS:2 [Acaulospora morrowiae]|uniref:13539_t:CDS:1 n=1 Tax=Acaulospora morrowiae TaxID=94023 RepID=A0A9N8ZHM8_9GLOM|nr:13539_t:CDS:2 [Acaulospora morrowiae]